MIPLAVQCFLGILVLPGILRAENPSGRLIDGEVVTTHDYPWMAAIRTTKNGNSLLCGGSLVSSNLVLTAAHCVESVSQNNTGEITLGALNLDAKDDGETYTFSDVIIHEKYSSSSHENDLALIKLPMSVNTSANISTVTLVNLLDIAKTYVDETGVITGWGKVQDTDANYSNDLRMINVTIIPIISCNIAYLFTLTENQMCTTGVYKKNICLGDAGSPLLVDKVQVGIASYGGDFGCATGFPGVYTRLTSYMGWIYAKIDTYSNDVQ